MATITLFEGISRPKLTTRIGRPIKWMWNKTFGNGRWVALALLVALTALRVVDPQPVELLRLKVFDLFQILAPRPAQEPNVMVIDLDEESLQKIGQWPWPRTMIADMIRSTAEAGAVLVGFDVVFAEEDRLSPEKFAKDTRNLPPEMVQMLTAMPRNDEVFANVIRQARSVLGQAGGVIVGQQSTLTEPAALAWIGPNPRPHMIAFESIIGNQPVLEKASVGRGMFIVNPEVDNIVRRVPAVSRVDQKVFPTLSIEMLRVAFGASTLLIRGDELGIKDVVIQTDAQRYIIPTDQKGRLWPHYSRVDTKPGSPGNRYIPAMKFVPGETYDQNAVNMTRGKLVLFGASAAGLRDIRSTPVDEFLPGVEVHAQLLESILTDSLLNAPSWGAALETVMPIAVGLLMILGLAFVGARWTLFVFLAVAAIGFGTSWVLFKEEKLLVDAAYPVVTAFLIYIVVTYMSYMKEEADRRQIKSAFSQYLSPALVDKLAANPDQLKLGGEMRDMTILFSDVRGFTTISEMFDAQGLTQFMNRYLTPMTDIAQGTGAYIDKYIGDAIMAFWNAPLDDPNHAKNACKTVIQMRSRLVSLNEELKAEAEANNTKFIEIKIGIGLNTGPCVVGNMGSEQKTNYSVLGDAVNLASRLEGQSKPYHLDNIIGEATYAEAQEYPALEVDLIRVKGKTIPVRIFTLVGEVELKTREDFVALEAHHNEMLAKFRGQDWDGATDAIVRCRAIAVNFGIADLYEVYEERIAEYRANPPPADWDGVYVATSK